MKLLISSAIALGLFVPTSVMAQQITNYPVCTNYQENYRPGGYDAYGNYIQGNVITDRYNYNCANTPYYNRQGYYYNAPRPYYQREYYNNPYPYRPYAYGYNGYNNGYYGTPANPNCNPTRTLFGSVLGGSLGAAFSHKQSTRNWAVPFGAALGGLAYSC